MQSKTACSSLIFTLIATVVMLLPARLFAEFASDAELAKVQGVWERKTGEDIPGMHRATKEIRANHEVVTYYGAGDELLRSHEVDFRLETRGGVNVFTYFNWMAIEGPEKGRKAPQEVSYIYRADDNTFVEVWGLLPGQEQRTPRLMMWVKKPPENPAMREELKTLQGTWIPVADAGQKASAAADIFGDDLTIKEDDFVVRRKNHILLKGVIRLTPAQSPQAIDMILTQTPNGSKNGQCIHAIYEFKDGELHWCGSAPNHPRPHEFSAREKSTQNFAVLKREETPTTAKP